MNMQTHELQDYLYKIADKSLAGEIEWNQSNPSTFQWIQQSHGEIFHVTIQKAGKPFASLSRTIRESMSAQEGTTFLFQVVDKNSKQTVISLSSKERPEFYEPLFRIYHSAEKGMDFRAASVLQRLLIN